MLRTALIIALALPSLLGALSAALADVKTPSGRVIECYCTDRYGKRHELGDIICLTVGDRSYMAKCIMAQNVPFWRDQKMGCLSSRAPMSPRPTIMATLLPKRVNFFPAKD